MTYQAEGFHMHEDYNGVSEKPFNLTPDPKYLYKSHSHANAFDLLDQNPACDANAWTGNVFGTAFPACAGV